jgi:hypothetical protein
VFGGNRLVAAIRLIVRHQSPLLRGKHLCVFGYLGVALEDHRAVIGGGEHGIGGVYPVRGDRAVDLADFERALLVREQVFELLIGAMQVNLDGRAEEQERIEPDVRLALGADGDEVSELLARDEIAQGVVGNIGVVVVEDHVRCLC